MVMVVMSVEVRDVVRIGVKGVLCLCVVVLVVVLEFERA